jgi:hypothetical protein
MEKAKSNVPSIFKNTERGCASLKQAWINHHAKIATMLGRQNLKKKFRKHVGMKLKMILPPITIIFNRGIQ